MLLYYFQCIFLLCKRNNRENGPEYFLFHYRIIQIHLVKHGGFNKQELLIHPATVNYFAVGQIAGYTIEVFLIYDLAIIITVLRLITEKLLNCLFQVFNKFVFY